MKNSERWIPKNIYKIFENKNYKIWLSGILFFNRKLVDCDEKIFDLAEFLQNKELDFNKLNGYFKLVIYSKYESNYSFIGDNSNSQYFYYDAVNRIFSDSFISLRKNISNPNIDYAAISELFTLGTILEENTLVEEVKKTDSNYYYILDNEGIKRFPKNLIAFNKLNNYSFSFENTMHLLLSNIPSKNIGAVITGGTDSRTVLSYMHYFGVRPKLVITGHKDNPDISVAKKISSKLDLSLTIIEPDEINDDRIKQGYNFLDGVYDPVLAYRHYLKANWNFENNISYEFGGVGGEFYKNDSCHPFINGIWGYKKYHYYYRTILKRNIKHLHWLGSNVIDSFNNNQLKLMNISRLANEESCFLAKCNRVFFELLKNRCGSITNGYSKKCNKIEPLMDRNLIGFSSRTSVFNHEFKLWQKRKISKYCKIIADIETDQGYTCSLRRKFFLTDVIRLLIHNFKRLLAKINTIYNKRNPSLWIKDYEEARKTNYWKKAICFCKKNKIIAENVKESEIPFGITGNIILIAMTFGEDSF